MDFWGFLVYAFSALASTAVPYAWTKNQIKQSSIERDRSCIWSRLEEQWLRFQLISITKKKKGSIFNNLRDTAHQKSLFCTAFDDFYVFVSPSVLKIEHFFCLQSIDNQKIVRVTIYQWSI